jgi:energy-coupling factor transporter ATP-binding protein EcfA2
LDAERKPIFLSSGQNIFVNLVINLLSTIKKNSLIIVDEPENALHPNLEIEFMKLFKAILDEFDSFAIIATHSAIITREVPRNFVHVIKINEKDDSPVIIPPTINTFGANIGTIINYVFDDVFVSEKPYKDWLEKQKTLYDSFDSFEREFGQKLGYDFMLTCRNEWDQHD